MTEQEYERKKKIKELVEHPDFISIIDNMKFELGQKMLDTTDPDGRDSLFYEAKAINSLVGQLTGIANEVRTYGG